MPDPPHVLTSNAGWDTIGKKEFLKKTINKIKSMGIRTSIFIEPNNELIQEAAKIGTDRIELYTEPYASNFKACPEDAVKNYKDAAIIAHEKWVRN